MTRDTTPSARVRFHNLVMAFVRQTIESEEEMEEFWGSGAELEDWHDWIANSWRQGGPNFYREMRPEGFAVVEFLELLATARELMPEWYAPTLEDWSTEECAWNMIFYAHTYGLRDPEYLPSPPLAQNQG